MKFSFEQGFKITNAITDRLIEYGLSEDVATDLGTEIFFSDVVPTLDLKPDDNHLMDMEKALAAAIMQSM